MNISELAKRAKAIAESKGFTITNFGESIALAHSELSEALEAHRNPNNYADYIAQGEHIAEELADTVIRVSHLAEHMGLDLEGAIEKKMNKNTERPFMHGGKSY